MHKETRVVFDELISTGPVTLYTGLLHTDFLSEAHQLGVQTILSTSATSGSVDLTVRIQQSADGRNWLNKNTSPELSGTITLTPGVGEWSLAGGESWPALPRLRFVMLSIGVTLRSVSATIRLQVLASARTRRSVEPEAVVAPPRIARVTRREAMARLLAMRPATLDEVERQMRLARPGDGLGRLIERLSPAARADLERVARIFRALDPAQKRAALIFAGALASLAMLPPEQSLKPVSPALA